MAVAGLVLRLLMVFAVHPVCPFNAEGWVQGQPTVADFEALQRTDDGCFRIGGDALHLYIQGRLLAQGKGFVSVSGYAFTGQAIEGAGKPPAVPVTTALLAKVGLTGPDATRVVQAILGSLAIVIIGYLAWMLGGRRIGVIAALVAAFYPMLWINDWKLLNESHYVLFISLVFLAAYRFWVRPTPARAAWFGAAMGLAGYARPEVPLLIVFVALPLTLALHRLRLRLRAKLWLLASMSAVIALLPWTLYNYARFGEPLLTTGPGTVLLNGSCDSTYYGDRIGQLDFKCFDAIQLVTTRALGGSGLDELSNDRIYQEQATTYIKQNAKRVPVVAAARLARMWDLYRPAENTEFNSRIEGRGSFDSWAALVVYFALLPFMIGGLVMMWRRRIPISPIVGMMLVVSVTAMLSFALTRYRVSADVGLSVAAAFGIDATIRWILRGSKAKAEDERVLTDNLALAGAAPSVKKAVARDHHERRHVPKPVVASLVVLLAIVVAVVAWSSTVESQQIEASRAVDSRSAEPADPNARICSFTRSKGLDQATTYGSFDAQSVAAPIADLRTLRTMLPPAQQADLDVALGFLQALQASGQPGLEFIKTQPQTELQKVVEALNRLVGYQRSICGGSS